MGWFYFIGIAIMFGFENLPLGLFIIAVAFVWAIFFPKKNETAQQPAAAPKRTIVHNCPFCGMPYDKWQRPETGKLRICYHCKRNCYGDGSTVGLNEQDKRTLAEEANDIQRVNSGACDNELKYAFSYWHRDIPYVNKCSFGFQNGKLYFNHDSDNRYTRTWTIIGISTFAGDAALTYRMESIVRQELEKYGDFYTISVRDREIEITNRIIEPR